MATIKDLKQVHLDQVPAPYRELAEGIAALLKDYEQEQDKALFEKEAKDNIEAYYDMVQTVAPGALIATKVLPKQDKESTNAPLQKAITDLSNLLEAYQKQGGGDLEGILENTITGLQKLPGSHVERKALHTNIKETVAPMLHFESQINDNQAMRHGQVIETDKPFRKWMINVVETLLGKTGEKAPGSVKKEKDNTEKKKKEQSEQAMARIRQHDTDIEACRAVIRAYNKKKRQAQGPYPKKTRRTRLKEAALRIIKLTPPELQAEPSVQKENRRLIENLVRDFMKNWGMTQLAQARRAIAKDMDILQDKVTTQQQADTARKWMGNMPALDKIITQEKRRNPTILKEAAEAILKDLKQAANLFKTDKKKAKAFLDEHLDKDRQKVYLPEDIRDALKKI